MARKDPSQLDCSVARATEVIGERWTLLILRDALYGVTRFVDFQADLGIARNILSNRLRWLVAHGVMTRQLYQEQPQRYEYLLTDKGRDFFPVLVALMRWGDTWAANGEAPRTLTHHACGREGVHSLASCSNCGQELKAESVHIDPLPKTIRHRLDEAIERWRHDLTDLPTN